MIFYLSFILIIINCINIYKMKQIYIKLKNNIEENKYQLNKKIEKITNKQVNEKSLFRCK